MTPTKRKELEGKVKEKLIYTVWQLTDYSKETLQKNYDTSKLKNLEIDLVSLFDRYLQEEVERASDDGFKEGQRVGQYQVANRLYGHITGIYMFREGDKKATAIADSNATDLLKDCEKYLNHNSKTYKSYLRSERYRRFHPNEKPLAPPQPVKERE